MFEATLNVGQRHRRRANINPALVQSIVTVPPVCMHPQHEVLIRTECLLASKCFVFTGLNAASSPSKHEALNQCWFDAGPALQTVGQHWVNVVFAGSVDKCFVPKRNNKFRLKHSLYCPQVPFNNIITKAIDTTSIS